MEKASIIDLDNAVKMLVENEIGILLLESDTDTKNMYDILAERTTYEDRQGMYGNETHVTYHLYPLMYHKDLLPDQDLIHVRANALHNVFTRWTELGKNTRHAKDPFVCKAFMKYLDEIGYNDADYMLLLVE